MGSFREWPVMRTVPQFIGLAYREAVALERASGLRIVGPAPDAAPISNSWWEHQESVVLTQSPPAGARIDRRDAVTITLGPPEAPVAARTRPRLPPALRAGVDEAGGEQGVSFQR